MANFFNISLEEEKEG